MATTIRRIDDWSEALPKWRLDEGAVKQKFGVGKVLFVAVTVFQSDQSRYMS